MSALRAASWLLPSRLRGNWRLLLVAGVGVLAASALLAATPIYAAAMSELGLQFRLAAALGDDRLASVTLEGLLASPQDAARRDALDQLLERRLGWLGHGTAAVDRSERFAAQLGTARPQEPADWAAFVHAIGRLEDHVTVAAGRLPDATAPRPEAVLLEGFERHVPLGGTLSLQGAGFDDCQRRPISEDPDEARAEVQCRPSTSLAQRLEVTVVGFVRPADPTGPTWAVYGARLEVPDGPRFAQGAPLSTRDRAEAAAGVGSLPLLVPAEALTGTLAAAAPLTSWRHRAGFLVDTAGVRRNEVARGIAEYEALRVDLEDRLELSPTYLIPIVQALTDFRLSQSFNQVPLLILLLQVTGIALYYLVIVSQAIVEREAEELSVLGSRGASPAQVTAVHTLEACVIAIPAVVAGPLVAAAGISLLGWTPAFDVLTGRQLLPVGTPPLAFLLAALGGLLAVAAMVLPVALRPEGSIAALELVSARPAMRSFLQRYYLDLAVVALAALLLWELRRRGTVYAPGALGGWSSDPLLLAAPFVAALAAAALLLRFYPPLLRLGAGLLALGRGTAPALGLRRAARAPAVYARLLLLIVLALAVGTFAASYAPTVQASREDRTRYEAGADARLVLSGTSPVDAESAARAVRAIEGVGGAALATRTTLTTAGGTSLNTLGVDADQLPAVAWFRDDFAAEPLGALARRLQSAVPPGGGIEFPPDVTAIEVSVFSDSPRTYSVIWARVRDGTGRFANLDLGGAALEGWATLSTAVPEELARPVMFTGLLITDARAVGVQRQGSLFFDDVKVLVAGGPPQLIDDFEGRLGWVHFGAQRSTERFERSEEHARSGSSALRWQWSPGAPDGRRLLAINPGNVPLSAIVSETALAGLGARVGDTVALYLDGIRVPVAIRAVVSLFPTLNTEPGFVVLNRRDLEALAQLLETPSARSPGELWVDLRDTDGGGRAVALEAVRRQLGTAAVEGGGLDAGATIEASRTDPTLQASGSGILGAAFAAVLGLSLLGFLVSVTARERARLVEAAVLRAVGLSRGDLLRSLAVEWGTVVVGGVALGVVLGRRIAGVMMTFLDVTESGARAVPPFIVQTSWEVVALGALGLGAGIALGIVGVWRASMRRADAAQLRLTR